MRTARTKAIPLAMAALVASATILSVPHAANAGCGCSKPPPAPAQVRPSVAWSGIPISIFGSALKDGTGVRVVFQSATSAQPVAVDGTVVVRRDLADGAARPQVVVPLPALPLGPASITVLAANGGATLVSSPATDFTVAPAPLAIPSGAGEFTWSGYQAAVGSDGVVYLSLTVADVRHPMIFDASAVGYPLRFNAEDVVLYNAQGFLMQLLIEDGKRKKAKPMPGMFVFPASDATYRSNGVHYSRHEFNTYVLQHQEREPHAVDANDPNWHVDGTRHVDHDHLILALVARFADGSTPRPGATTAFDLVLRTSSLFSNGIVGVDSLSLAGNASTRGFDSKTGSPATGGDVLTGGTLSMRGTSFVDGDATADRIKLSNQAVIRGTVGTLATRPSYVEVQAPSMIPQLGAIQLEATTRTIVGPGTFAVSSLRLRDGATLYVDNSAGPVTLYVGGELSVTNGGRIEAADADPQNLAVYVDAGKSVKLSGTGSSFHGVLYAPNSTVSISGESQVRGALVGSAVKLEDQGQAHFDRALTLP